MAHWLSRCKGRLLYLILWIETGICRYGCKWKPLRQNTREFDISLVTIGGSNQVCRHNLRRNALMPCLMLTLIVYCPNSSLSHITLHESHRRLTYLSDCASNNVVGQCFDQSASLYVLNYDARTPIYLTSNLEFASSLVRHLHIISWVNFVESENIIANAIYD